MSKEDMSVAGPGSPISMQKFTDYLDSTKPLAKQPQFVVMLNQTGGGILQDNPELVQVTVANRVMQAHYWRDTFWNGKQISAYLYRYVYYMMEEEEHKKENYKYPTNESIVEALTNGSLTETSDEFIKMKASFEWLKTSNEITHIVGLVQLVGGSLRAAAKQSSHLRMFIEEPETGMHPKRQQKLVSLLDMLAKDYGFSPENFDKDLNATREFLKE